MEIKIPRYFDPAENLTYEADSCTPLKKAWENNELELTTLARGTYPGKKLGDNELKGIKSVGYWNIKKLQNWGLDWHTNEGIEICYLESGDLDFHVHNQQYKLKTNDITLTRPWTIHKIGSPLVNLSKLHWIIIDVKVRRPHQPWEWPEWIVINKNDLNELTRYFRQNEKPVWKSNADFRNCFIQIGNIVKHNDLQYYDSKIKIQINNLLVLLLEIFKEGKITLDESLVESKRSVELFLSTLEQNILEDWNVVKMAEFCHLGVTRFTHYCKEITNCSPMEYLNRLRLKKASEILISDSTVPVSDVGYMSGFSSSQYFNYSFRRYFNLTPGEYRRKNICVQKNKD